MSYGLMQMGHHEEDRMIFGGGDDDGNGLDDVERAGNEK